MSGRKLTAVLTMLTLLTASACQTWPGNKPAPIAPLVAASRPTVEHTVGEFTFAMNANEMKQSTVDGRLLTNEIMKVWKRREYIAEARFIDKGDPFSGTADFNLTISGSQHNSVSFWRELLNALTLMWIPYSVTREYDLRYELREVKTGNTYRASIRGEDQAQVEIFLIFTLPIAFRGHNEILDRMGDHLYQQFAEQGAFAVPEAPAVLP